MERLTTSAVGFKQRNIDECVLYRGNTMHILYTDDYILEGTDKKELRHIVADIKAAGLNITKQGDIKDFLEFNI